ARADARRRVAGSGTPRGRGWDAAGARRRARTAAGARRLPRAPGDRLPARRARRARRTSGARQAVAGLPRSPRRVRRAAEPVRRRPLPLARRRQRHAAAVPARHRLHLRGRGDGHPPPRAARRRRAVPPRERDDARRRRAPPQLPRDPSCRRERPMTTFSTPVETTVLRRIVDSLLCGHDLSEADARALLVALADEDVPPALKGAALGALRVKGETAEEVRGLATRVREPATPLPGGPPWD